MLFHIKHTTRYRYSKAVFCEPLIVRLRPREDGSQRLIRYHLTVDPQPVGQCEYLDVEGNSATQCWFNVPTCTLLITTNCVVETLRINPFDYLLETGAMELPVRYRPESRAALAPYQAHEQPPDGVVVEFANEILSSAKRQTIVFLTKLCGWIAGSFHKEIRPEGDPLPPEVTLAKRSGSCRDLAVLFIEACRAVGLAARFVSGYQGALDDDGDRHLHAWAEVFLPGAGWRGYDPGQGLAVADQHVVVASGLTPLAAAPSTGTFRGTGVTSTLESQIVIRTSDSALNQSQTQVLPAMQPLS
jgi:transglutaminase-like putative cysteine protease